EPQLEARVPVESALINFRLEFNPKKRTKINKREAIILSSPNRPEDGQDVTFSVTVTSDRTPTDYQWSWKSPRGAGNNPSVTFDQRGVPDVNVLRSKWFARPNQECPPTFDELVAQARDNSVYDIKCKIRFNRGRAVTVESGLIVDAWKPVGGETG